MMIEKIKDFYEKFEGRRKERRYSDDKQIKEIFKHTFSVLEKDFSKYKSEFENTMSIFKIPYIFSIVSRNDLNHFWEEDTGIGQRANLHPHYNKFLHNLSTENWNLSTQNLDKFILNYLKCIHNNYLDQIFYGDDDKEYEIECHCEVLRELNKKLKEYESTK